MSDEPRNIKVTVPELVQAGVYSDQAMVWHNEHGFTIDFLAPIQPAGPDAEGKITQPAAVVARVRLPVSVMFQLARAISENVSRYEASHGKIPAGGPDHPPQERS